MSMPRAELGQDGNCAFALLGENTQDGEVEFVEVANPRDWREVRQASYRALHNLRVRLNNPDITYWIGPSHPYHR